jgi:hypothetical protein
MERGRSKGKRMMQLSKKYLQKESYQCTTEEIEPGAEDERDLEVNFEV